MAENPEAEVQREDDTDFPDLDTLMFLWQELTRDWNVTPWKNPFTLATVLSIFRMASFEFSEKKKLLEISAGVTIVGDLHGNFAQLYRIINNVRVQGNSFTDAPLLFLGDYVDRGTDSLRTLLMVCLGSILFRDFHVLRGNHECKGVNTRYGFLDECKRTYGEKDGKTIHTAANQMFGYMPVACLVGKSDLNGTSKTTQNREITPEKRKTTRTQLYKKYRIYSPSFMPTFWFFY
ncbi:unnamed protein product [Caenorhabditis nigoni]